MKKYLISIICFFIFLSNAFSEIKNISSLEDLKNFTNSHEVNFLINKPITINEDTYIPKNITLKFIEEGKFIIDENFKLIIDGKISKTKKKYLYLLKKITL